MGWFAVSFQRMLLLPSPLYSGERGGIPLSPEYRGEGRKTATLGSGSK
jgi:hypothetical protein